MGTPDGGSGRSYQIPGGRSPGATVAPARHLRRIPDPGDVGSRAKSSRMVARALLAPTLLSRAGAGRDVGGRAMTRTHHVLIALAALLCAPVAWADAPSPFTPGEETTFRVT